MRYKKDFEKLNEKLNNIVAELEKYNQEIDDYNSGRSEAFIEKKGDNLDSLINQLDKTIDSLYQSCNKLDFVINDF